MRDPSTLNKRNREDRSRSEHHDDRSFSDDPDIVDERIGAHK